MKNSIIQGSRLKKCLLVTIIWLVIWEIVSLIVDNNILMASPWQVLLTFIEMCQSIDFYKSILFSLSKIILGSAIGAALGIILSALSYKWEILEDILSPLITFMKSVPVASFVVLVLIWSGSDVLSIVICVFVVLPQIYVSMLNGLKCTDEKLKEMGKVFCLGKKDLFHYIYRPTVLEHVEGAASISAGMAWKAGVAAEVIGTPDFSIGEGLYMSKIYLDTASVIAWTVTIIILSMLCEKAVVYIIGKYALYDFKCQGALKSHAEAVVNHVVLEKICKAYDDKAVLNDYSEEFVSSRVYNYDWPSGKGKTTLFRIIAGLEEADSGEIFPKDYSVSFVFQEDRLIEQFDAVKNVELICGDVDEAKKILLELLCEDDIYKPVKTLSGGQKRRVAIARAMAKISDIMIFDEPYEGLDVDMRLKVRCLIDKYCGDKIVLIASHIKCDMKNGGVGNEINRDFSGNRLQRG